jgi:hypothetical protein
MAVSLTLAFRRSNAKNRFIDSIIALLPCLLTLAVSGEDFFYGGFQDTDRVGYDADLQQLISRLINSSSFFSTAHHHTHKRKKT